MYSVGTCAWSLIARRAWVQISWLANAVMLLENFTPAKPLLIHSLSRRAVGLFRRPYSWSFPPLLSLFTQRTCSLPGTLCCFK